MKHVSLLVPDEQSGLSTLACIVGTLQLFDAANAYRIQKGGSALFAVALVGAQRGASLQLNGLSVSAQYSVADVRDTQLIIIPASSIRSYEGSTSNNRILIDWVAQQYKQGAEIASMCVGGFMLAASGLLDGKTCSTHWALSEPFRELYPEVKLQTDRLITDERGIYTNGGAYSFLHLLLYLVGKFYGRETALHCAKYFQIDVDRTAQAEFSVFHGYKKHQDPEIRSAQQVLEQEYADKISIEKLAERLHVGRRNFDRRFLKATGMTPLDYLQRVRTEAAKQLFETTRKTVNEIMYEVGYNDAKAFRDVFSRVTGLSPLEYKQKYNQGGHLLTV